MAESPKTTHSGAAAKPPAAPQLSASRGVTSSVSTLAMNGGVLGAQLASGNDASPSALGAALYEALSDAEVMLRAKAGDDAAYEFLVEKFRRPMLSFMYRAVHNTSIAEELAQEVFLRVYRSRQTYNAEAKFSTWLYRIATNLAANYARDTKTERMQGGVSLDEPDEETGTTIDVADSRPNIEQDLLRSERLEAIRRHVQALPERQRNAVLMHKYQGLDYRQIAQVLNLSESATKSLLFRAYETLRERLKDFI